MLSASQFLFTHVKSIANFKDSVKLYVHILLIAFIFSDGYNFIWNQFFLQMNHFPDVQDMCIKGAVHI